MTPRDSSSCKPCSICALARADAALAAVAHLDLGFTRQIDRQLAERRRVPVGTAAGNDFAEDDPFHRPHRRCPAGGALLFHLNLDVVDMGFPIGVVIDPHQFHKLASL